MRTAEPAAYDNLRGRDQGLASAAIGAVEKVTERGNWLTNGDTGTLTREGLAAVLGACEELEARPRECASQVVNRVGPFASMDDPEAREAKLLLRECNELEELSDCREKILLKRYLLDQPIGEANPHTLEMSEGVQTEWLVSINDSDATREPGGTRAYTDTRSADGDVTRTRVSNAITYTEDTCFELEYDRNLFEVVKDTDCPEFREGSTPYIARWRVTPKDAGNLQLTVKAAHRIDGEPVNVETVPTSPFTIAVESRLERWIAELKLWEKLAILIGSILSTIAGWKIWQHFKRRDPSKVSKP